jgi:protein-S-isoprenylcysteine O-methyltransferase Ste14
MSLAETTPDSKIVQRRTLAGHVNERCAASVDEATRPRPIDGVLDWIERLVTLTLYAWFVYRIVSSYLQDGGVGNLLFLPSEGLVVFFLLIRRRATIISRHTGDWLVAFVATNDNLLVSPVPGRALIPAQWAAGVLLAGLLIQVLAKITLGRSLGCVPAHRGLKLSGAYRYLRHPMYAGYLLGHLAFLGMNPSVWNVAIYMLDLGLLLYRIQAEERLLSRDPRYVHYRCVVRYRLVPGLY